MSSWIIYLRETTYANILGHRKPKTKAYQLTMSEWHVINYYNSSKENGHFEPIQTKHELVSPRIYCHVITYLKSTAMSTKRDIFIFKVK